MTLQLGFGGRPDLDRVIYIGAAPVEDTIDLLSRYAEGRGISIRLLGREGVVVCQFLDQEDRYRFDHEVFGPLYRVNIPYPTNPDDGPF